MRKDNTQNYQTSNTRIQHFSDYNDNISKEKEDLKRVKRSYVDNEDQVHNLPNVSKFKYNRVSNKMDDVSQDQIDDRIESTDVIKTPKHKYKIVGENIKSFEAFDGGIDSPTPTNIEPYKNGADDYEIENGEEYSDEMPSDDENYWTGDDDDKHQNYMFFGNLESIKRMVDELLEMDRDQVDEILTNGHDWAEDHITRSKENIQQVHNFLKTEFE